MKQTPSRPQWLKVQSFLSTSYFILLGVSREVLLIEVPQGPRLTESLLSPSSQQELSAFATAVGESMKICTPGGNTKHIFACFIGLCKSHGHPYTQGVGNPS